MTDPLTQPGSISPLPTEYRKALTVMASLGTVSLVATVTLWLHITYKLCTWKLRDTYAERDNRPKPVVVESGADEAEVDLNLGLTENHYRQAKNVGRQRAESGGAQSTMTVREQSTVRSVRRTKPPNPLLIMIYNLIFADATLAAVYLGNFVWLKNDGILAGTFTCKFQGWTVSFGLITTSGFLCCMAAYTYFSIVKGYKPPVRIVLINIICIWIFAIVINCIGPIVVNKIDYYARNSLGCWINPDYGYWRMTVYIPGFLFFGVGCVFYLLTYWAIWTEHRDSRFMPASHHSSRSGSTNNSRSGDPSTRSTALRPSGHHPAFLIYPFLYLLSAGPLAVSNAASIAKSFNFQVFIGIMLASTGLLDTLLWSTIIIFSRSEDLVNTGLDQFAFLRTPEERNFGNMIWVQGNAYGESDRLKRKKAASLNGNKGRWWRLGALHGSDRNLSQLSLRHNDQAQGTVSPREDHGIGIEHGIQMDIVTTVVVEDERELGRKDSTIKSLDL